MVMIQRPTADALCTINHVFYNTSSTSELVPEVLTYLIDPYGRHDSFFAHRPLLHHRR